MFSHGWISNVNRIEVNQGSLLIEILTRCFVWRRKKRFLFFPFFLFVCDFLGVDHSSISMSLNLWFKSCWHVCCFSSSFEIRVLIFKYQVMIFEARVSESRIWIFESRVRFGSLVYSQNCWVVSLDFKFWVVEFVSLELTWLLFEMFIACPELPVLKTNRHPVETSLVIVHLAPKHIPVDLSQSPPSSNSIKLLELSEWRSQFLIVWIGH